MMILFNADQITYHMMCFPFAMMASQFCLQIDNLKADVYVYIIAGCLVQVPY